MSAHAEAILFSVENVLADALSLRDASLVVFRRGVLVEFKTQMLEAKLSRCAEPGHRGWQIGPFDGHHCHLDLDSVIQVCFDAAPSPCQGGHLNYTIWFLAARDCGNPYRTDGYFSITLNAPYFENGDPRLDVIEEVHALYALHRHRPGVLANEGFERAAGLLQFGTHDPKG